LFGIPDVETRQVKAQIAVPGMLSFLVNNDPKAPVIGLDKVPRHLWPPVGVPFATYHLMVALGMFFIGLTLCAWFLYWRGKLFTLRPFLWVVAISVLGPFIANECGWVAAEVGRQPWVVHPSVIRDASGQPQFDAAGMIQYRMEEGLLTSKGVSPSVRGGDVLASIVLFGVIYALLFWIWLYVLNDKIQKGPKPVVLKPHSGGTGWLESTADRTLHRDSLSEAKDMGEEGVR
jgi:cytochrome d ubiquinol oxidase subunit I